MILLLFVGCGDGRQYSKTEMVEGVVTLDGVPVEGAEIIFYPVDHSTGEGATGRTDSQGRYRLSSVRGAPGRGVPAGEYGITVSHWVVTKLDEPYINIADDSWVRFRSEEMLPGVYTEIETSPLRATVVTGNNTIDLELHSTTRPSR
jgi:hypothetical protein